MARLETFVGVFYRLFERFLDLRKSAKDWERTVAAMQTWIGERTGRA